MASFTSVGDNIVIDIIEAAKSNVEIAISGTYNMTIAFQREMASVGSGAWQTILLFEQANATINVDYPHHRAERERYRLIVLQDTSGTATATLTYSVLAASSVPEHTHDDGEITAAGSATNYTPTESTVEGHLAGIDTALGGFDDGDVTAAATATNYTPTEATVEGHLAGIDSAFISHEHSVSDITGGEDGQLMGWGTDDAGEAKDPASYLNPEQATDNEVTTGTETEVRLYSPEQLKLAAETHGSGGGGSFGDETEDSNTSITVGAADGVHKSLTGTGAITLTLSQTAADGVRQAFTPKTDQTITVTPATNARYIVPGDTDASVTTNVTDAVWETPSGDDVEISSAGANLPDYDAGDLFEIRNHSTAANNGYYIATGTPTTSSLTSTKIDGTAPQAAASEAVDVDTLQRQASFTLTGYGEFECIENTGGDAAVWRFDGASDLDAAIDGNLAITGTTTFTGRPIGIVETISGHIETADDKTYVLDLKAPYAYTVNSLAAKTASGTCTAKLTIDGVDVTGITALAVSSSEDFDDASAANSVSVGNTLALVISSNSSALDLQFTVKVTRA